MCPVLFRFCFVFVFVFLSVRTRLFCRLPEVELVDEQVPHTQPAAAGRRRSGSSRFHQMSLKSAKVHAVFAVCAPAQAVEPPKKGRCAKSTSIRLSCIYGSVPITCLSEVPFPLAVRHLPFLLFCSGWRGRPSLLCIYVLPFVFGMTTRQHERCGFNYN